MKLISFSHQDDYENGDVLLHYRYQKCRDLVEGERVLMFEGDTHDKSCEAILVRGDFGYQAELGPRFKDLWIARLDEMTWRDLSQDELTDYYRREHAPFSGVPTGPEWREVFRPQYESGEHAAERAGRTN